MTFTKGEAGLILVLGLGLACNGTDSTTDPVAAETAGDPAGTTSGAPPTSDTMVPPVTTGTAPATSGSSGDPNDSSPIIFDVNDPTGGVGGCQGGKTDLALSGTVWAPNGVIPVSGALVYTSAGIPAGITQGVHCAECEPLGCDDTFTTTEADGSFTLDALAIDAQYLIVQKGQFMKISPLDFGPGEEILDDALTTLPSENLPDSGWFIPQIAVGNGEFDRLEDGLGKFGLGDTIIESFEERLVPGTEPFDLWDNGRDPADDGFVSQGTFAQLVGDPKLLAQYHIIFAPCSTDTYTSALTPEGIQNIRDWVAAGGRWYVSDWANEWFAQVFPEYQDLQCMGVGDGACDNQSYNSLANILDPELLAWLEALPGPLGNINPLNNENTHPTLDDLPQVLTVDNWSSIVTIQPVLVPDGLGGNVDVGHKVWLEGFGGIGPVHPLTVTGQFGCGKIQFTSYHMAEFENYVGLSPQELVLLYTILEIGVCQDALPPPQG